MSKRQSSNAAGLLGHHTYEWNKEILSTLINLELLGDSCTFCSIVVKRYGMCTGVFFTERSKGTSML